ncbi:MAG TPA: carboxypeptidase-like regulatory domain-containing protein [Candidatus Hypogeohydataceae bacterium YC41]
MRTSRGVQIERPHLAIHTSPPKSFTLLEIITVIAIIAILGGAIVPLAFQDLNNKKIKATENKLLEFKSAIIGNPFFVDGEVRTSFGYLGDMGNLPGRLEDLYIKGTQPSYTYNAALKTGAGWRGPYLDPKILEDLTAVKLDGYGKELAYTTTEFIDAQIGASVTGEVISFGPDREMGGIDDLSVEVFRSEVFSTVSGYVKDMEGKRVPGITVRMNSPINGLLVQSIATTNDAGFFSFTNTPYGIRSITLEPRLVYAPDSAKTAGDAQDNLEFKITNLYSQNLSINSIIVNFSLFPEAYFSELWIAGQRVFNASAQRARSGQLINYTPVTISGSGATPSGQSHVIQVQSPQTQLGDFSLENVAAGGTVSLEIRGFKDRPTSGGDNPVNVSGTTFEISFSDGSTIIFTPTRH